MADPYGSIYVILAEDEATNTRRLTTLHVRFCAAHTFHGVRKSFCTRGSVYHDSTQFRGNLMDATRLIRL